MKRQWKEGRKKQKQKSITKESKATKRRGTGVSSMPKCPAYVLLEDLERLTTLCFFYEPLATQINIVDLLLDSTFHLLARVVGFWRWSHLNAVKNSLRSDSTLNGLGSIVLPCIERPLPFGKVHVPWAVGSLPICHFSWCVKRFRWIHGLLGIIERGSSTCIARVPQSKTCWIRWEIIPIFLLNINEKPIYKMLCPLAVLPRGSWPLFYLFRPLIGLLKE